MNIKLLNVKAFAFFSCTFLVINATNAQCWRTVTAAENRTTAIQNDGTLWTWGRNFENSLGDGTNFNRYTPYQISTATDWKSVTANYGHSLALKTDGALWGWGFNYDGELGNGTTALQPIPTRLGDAFWKSVSAGFSFCLGIKTDGSL